MRGACRCACVEGWGGGGLWGSCSFRPRCTDAQQPAPNPCSSQLHTNQDRSWLQPPPFPTTHHQPPPTLQMRAPTPCTPAHTLHPAPFKLAPGADQRHGPRRAARQRARRATLLCQADLVFRQGGGLGGLRQHSIGAATHGGGLRRVRQGVGWLMGGWVGGRVGCESMGKDGREEGQAMEQTGWWAGAQGQGKH